MFGIKKVYQNTIESYVTNKKKNKEFDDLKNIDTRTLSNSSNAFSEKLIYYSENKYEQHLEIHAILNNNENYKVMVLVDNSTSMNYLRIKIAEAFEIFPEFKKLNGLKAVDLHKKFDKKKMIQLSEEGIVQDSLMNGDIVYCNLISTEYWIKSIMNVSLYNREEEDLLTKNKFSFSIDFKIPLDIEFKIFKYVLIKFAFIYSMKNIFYFDANYNSKSTTTNYHYIITNINFTINKDKYNFNILSETCKSIDSNLIKNLFDFNSEIEITFNLISLEELLFNELKKIEYNNPYINIAKENLSKWKELMEINYDFFIFSEKFQLEKDYIFKYINDLLANKNEKEFLEKKCFVYYDKNNDDNNLNETFALKDYSESQMNINNINTYGNQNINILNNENDIYSVMSCNNKCVSFYDLNLNLNFGDYSTNRDKYSILLINDNNSNFQSKNDLDNILIEGDANSIYNNKILSKSSVPNDNDKNNNTINKNEKNTKEDFVDLENFLLPNKDDIITFDDNKKYIIKKKSSPKLSDTFFKRKVSYQINNGNKIKYKSKFDYLFGHKGNSNSVNLIDDFIRLFNKKNFIDKIISLYCVDIDKKLFEKIVMPEFRNFNKLNDDFDFKLFNNYQIDEDITIKKHKKNKIIFICGLLVILITAIIIIIIIKNI